MYPSPNHQIQSWWQSSSISHVLVYDYPQERVENAGDIIETKGSKLSRKIGKACQPSVNVLATMLSSIIRLKQSEKFLPK